jgi:hypothetical protein
MIVRHYAHPHGFIAGEDELRSLAEACEAASHDYRIMADATRPKFPHRREQRERKAEKFASLAKNLREILAED